MNRKPISFVVMISLLLPLVLSPNPGHASAAASVMASGLPTRTDKEVLSQWKKLMNPTTNINAPFATIPSTSKPYAPGSLHSQYIQDGVNAVNFYRFISGLPYDVTSTAALNAQAQYGAVLLASKGDFSHTPAQPADMPKAFYDKGYASTSTANIYASYGFDKHIVVSSIDAYIEDSDPSNLEVLGHRRWLLNPPLSKIGFGMAEGDEEWMYSTQQAFDQSRKKPVEYNYVAYPANGAFPVETFNTQAAWSVSLNMEKFKKPVEKNIRVYVKRLEDNKTSFLSTKNNKASEQGAYFNVDYRGYGSGTAIIFRPDGFTKYKANDRFKVTIQGLQAKNGASQSLSYTVNFISVAK